MSTTLQSKIRICKGIKLDKEYNNVLNYSSSNMLSLCESNSHLVASANDYSFIRNRGTISTNFNYDDALKCNYMAFQNKDYSNKWFFAFIDDVKYISDGCTEIEYTVDSWTTFFDDWTPDKCFVLREHTNDDTIGVNTIPEKLETGEYTQQPDYNGELFTYLNNTYICIAVTERVIERAGLPHIYNGLYSGLEYLLFPSNTDATSYINYVNSESKPDAIQNIFMIPASIVTTPEWFSFSESGFSFTYAFCPNSNTVTYMERMQYTIPNYIDQNYQPVNKKLLCYPYRFFNISNNAGQMYTYRYEDFNTTNTNGKCEFNLYGSLDCGCSLKLIPAYYKHNISNHVEGIDAGKLPTVAWTTDPYTNWLTQNGVNLGIQTALSLAGVVVGVGGAVASGGATVPLMIGAGAVVSGGSTITNALHQERMAQIQPDQAHGGSNQGNFNFCYKLSFTIQRMSIKTEYARCIDDYFTRYGYQTNRVKTPNITGRTYWNYIQIDARDDIAHGDIPNNYLETINNIARKGVTIWHSHDNIGNFSLSNTIVTP